MEVCEGDVAAMKAVPTRALNYDANAELDRGLSLPRLHG